jgi:hypothetical protein
MHNAATATLGDWCHPQSDGRLADGRAADEASREIGRSDTELETRSPLFSSVLLRSESAATSNIENLNALARAIAEQVMAG